MAKILVVDDDLITIGLISLSLTRHGHEVRTATNGKEALLLLHTETFDLLITDIIMPEMDGYDLLIRLLLQPKRPKVIAMSAGASDLDPKQVLDASSTLKVDATLVKPLKSDALHELVDRLLKQERTAGNEG